MSRSSTGTYTVPGSVNPVQSGTPITTSWAVTTLSDLATALTDSLSRTGKGGMVAGLKAFAGTSALPGYSWSDETSSGLYMAAAGDFRYRIGSFDILQILVSGLLVSDLAPSTTNYRVGYLDLPQIIFTADYAFIASSRGKHFFHPRSDTSARTATVPANASVAYPIGTTMTIVNDVGAGAVTIAVTTDTLVFAGAGTTGSRTLAAAGMATLLKVTDTMWFVSGVGLT